MEVDGDGGDARRDEGRTAGGEGYPRGALASRNVPETVEINLFTNKPPPV